MQSGFSRCVLLAVAVLWLSACSRADPPCTTQFFDGSRFTVCTVDTHRQPMEIAYADRNGVPYRSFAAYRRDHGSETVAFAMNAGMFRDDGSPVGLLRMDSLEVRGLETGDGDGNFYLKPNGVFFVETDGSVGIVPSEAFGVVDGVAHTATQSGPMLVIDGALHPQIQPDGPSRYVRNGVGVRDRGTAFFVISEDEVSFGKLARFFRDALKCPNALYLDGAVSSLWAPALGREDDEHLFGPMVIVRAPLRAVKAGALSLSDFGYP